MAKSGWVMVDWLVELEKTKKPPEIQLLEQKRLYFGTYFYISLFWFLSVTILKVHVAKNDVHAQLPNSPRPFGTLDSPSLSFLNYHGLSFLELDIEEPTNTYRDRILYDILGSSVLNCQFRTLFAVLCCPICAPCHSAWGCICLPGWAWEQALGQTDCGLWGKGDGELDSQPEILVLVQHLKHGKPWKSIMKAYLCWDWNLMKFVMCYHISIYCTRPTQPSRRVRIFLSEFKTI